MNIKKNRFFALTTASIVGVIIANNAALATEINDGVQENVKYSLEMVKNEPLIIQELNGQESPVEVVFDGTEADLVREADGTLSVAESVAVEDSLAGVLANAEEVIVVWEMNPDLGEVTVTGSRVRVPDHEFYIRDDNKAWSTIWTRNISSEGFICLSATLNPECSYSDILVRGTR